MSIARAQLLLAGIELLQEVHRQDPGSVSPRALLLVLGLPVPLPPPKEEEKPAGELGLDCRRLLLEIMRRAAFDWVLFRNHHKLAKKKLAKEAYVWLFKEEVGDYAWQTRKVEDRELTSFRSICMMLDLDIEVMRGKFRELTPARILNAGRPPETSHTYDHAAGVEIHLSASYDLEGDGEDDLLFGDLTMS
jgi:hypothetical protein